MRKRIMGGTFIVAATILAIHPTGIMKEENKSVVIQHDEVPSSSHVKEAAGISTSQLPITFVETIDGDTIKVRIKGKIETVRYLLVDTPESKKPGMCVQPYAKEAYIRNDQLVKSGSLTMEFEQGNTRDSYGRLLAYVYVDGKSVQETLLKEGFARVAYIMDPPYRFLPLFRADEKLAERNKVNIWSRPNYVTNWGFNGCGH